MGRFGSAFRRGMLALAVLAAAACAPIYRNHGYVPTEQDLAQIAVGTDTRETVAQAIGRPASTGLLNGSGWYYVGSRWKTVAWRAPEEIERQVVAVTFTEAGVVQNVERFGLERGRVVVLSRRVTDSNIQGVSLIRQLLGNIGNFSAEQFLNRGQ